MCGGTVSGSQPDRPHVRASPTPEAAMGTSLAAIAARPAATPVGVAACPSSPRSAPYAMPAPMPVA